MQRTIIELTDDLDNGPIAEGKGGTVTFEVDGREYEIDLRLKNEAALRKTLQPYLLAARVVKKGRGGGARRHRPGSGATAVAASAKTIRAWARANGYDVPDMGRISQEVLRAFEEAQAARSPHP